MASFKQLKFYLLLLSGLAISIIAIYLFFTSSVVDSLFNLGKLSYAPGLYNFGNNTTQEENISIDSGKSTYSLSVTVANTEAEREHGLMGVTSLGENSGMLFVFNDGDQIRTFWMKDTKIPLDMIFLSSKKQVVYIQRDVPICTSDPCTVYSSQFPAQYVIETNANWAINHNIQPGDLATF